MEIIQWKKKTSFRLKVYFFPVETFRHTKTDLNLMFKIANIVQSFSN